MGNDHFCNCKNTDVVTESNVFEQQGNVRAANMRKDTIKLPPSIQAKSFAWYSSAIDNRFHAKLYIYIAYIIACCTANINSQSCRFLHI